MEYNLRVSIPTKEHYVYAYYTSEGPFYIGVGQKSRMLSHLLGAKNPFLKRVLAKLSKDGTKIGIKVLYESDDRGEANEKEAALIHRYREKGVRLCNIADGGDGGDTYKGRRMYYNKTSKEIRVFSKGEVPAGWLPGRGTYEGPTVVCYHPKTKSITKVYAEADIPKGFVKGLPQGVKTGPKGKKIVSNPKTGEHRWVDQNEKLPKGWVKGRSHKSSTDGKVACYDSETKAMKFVASKADVPKGWRLGSAQKNGAKPVKIKGVRYETMTDAECKLGMSRYKILKTFKVVFLEK